MADLQALQAFAAANGFGLTRPLTHAQGVRLAEYWLPEMRFYENEKFHPISLAAVSTMIDDLFSALPASAQDEWRVSKLVRTGDFTGDVRTFDPPVVHVPDGAIPTQDGTSRPAFRVLGDGGDAEDAFEDAAVDADAVMTHGASFRRSDQFFGSRQTLSGGNVPAPGDPFVPRATDGDAAQITVVASFKGLLETLKYELLVEDADDYPPDGLRGGFDIAGSLLSPPSGPPSVLLPEERRKILLAMIEAVEAGEDATDVPPGWKLNKGAWDAVTRYAFLEYECYYAYNDFDRVQTTPFENEHEGDNEGCCLVFDRNVINVAAVGDDPDQLLRAVPSFLITSVHEESQDADLFLSIPPPIPPADDPARLPRDDLDLVVYVAWGSHATYLTPGDHDLVDFGDTWGLVGEKAPIVLALAPAAVLALALIISIIDHFVDTEDKTSEDGIHTGPPDVVADHPAAVSSALLALPMSAEEHIYQPQHETLLRQHAFPGKWGGHDGFIDKSPRYEPKTGRYFRKLLSSI